MRILTGRGSQGNGARRQGGKVAAKTILDNFSIYVPQEKLQKRPVERLLALGEKCDRSVNYLVVAAILAHLNREERKG